MGIWLIALFAILVCLVIAGVWAVLAGIEFVSELLED